MKNVVLSLALVLSLAACSSTPGDAASRAGRSEQAAQLYRRGADQGDGDAALKLGLLMESGSLPSAAYGSAGDWYVRGCDLGNVVACHNAGVAYEYGQSGLAKNVDQAQNRYQRAAERGYMQSQYNLGSLYSNGYLSDDVKGLGWLLASQRSAQRCAGQELCDWILKDPPGHISKLRARMTPQQEAEAEKLGVSWSAPR